MLINRTAVLDTFTQGLSGGIRYGKKYGNFYSFAPVCHNSCGIYLNFWDNFSTFLYDLWHNFVDQQLVVLNFLITTFVQPYLGSHLELIDI